MTQSVPDEFIDRMWAANRGRSHARLLNVLSVLDALAQREKADVGVGVRQAHALAGILGTYGRPGSDLLRETEVALSEPLEPAAAAELATRVRSLLNDLYG